MKKIKLTLIIIAITILNIYSQDVIFLKNGSEIISKVNEISIDIVKYKNWDNLDGPIYSIAKHEVFMIKYQNGSKDVFNIEQEKNITNNNDYSNKIVEDAKIFMEKRITVESEGACYLVDFEKLNGVEKNIFGQKMYILEYSLVIKVLREFWKASSDKWLGAEWFWTNFKILPNKGDINNYKYFVKGTYIKITGEI